MTEKIPTANPADGCPYCEYDKKTSKPCPDCGEKHDNERDFKRYLESAYPDAHPLDVKDNIGAYLAHKKQPDMVHNQHFSLLTGDKTRGRTKKPSSWGKLGKSSKSCPFCKDFAAMTAEHPMKIDNLVNLQDMHDRNPEAFHKKLDEHIKNIEKATMAVSSPKTGETCNCETGDHANAGGQEHGMFNQDIGRQTWQGQGLPQPKQDKDSCQCDEKPAEANKVPNADARLGDDEDEKKKAYCQCNKISASDFKGQHGARPTGDFSPDEAVDLDEGLALHEGRVGDSKVGTRHYAPPKKQSPMDKYVLNHLSPEGLQQHEMRTYDPDLAEKLTGKSLFDKIYDGITKKNPRTNWQERSRMSTEENIPYGKRGIPASRVGNRGDEKIGNNIQNDTSSTLEDRINLKLRRGERLPKGGKLKPNFASFDPDLAEKLTANKADDDEQITGTSTGAKTTKNPKKYLHKPSEHNPMGVINPAWTDWRAARRKQLKEGKRESNAKKLLENMSAETKLNLQTQAKLISAGTQNINDQKRAEQNKKRKKMTKQQLAARRKRLLGKAILKIKAMLERLKTERGDGTWGMRGLGEGEGTTDVQGSGDTHLISPVKQKELDRAMAGAKYYPRSVSRKKPEPDIYQ